MEKKPDYSEAIEELELILSEIENAEISVDELANKIKRASELIKICKEKLTTTEQEVKSILKDIEPETEEGFRDRV